MRTCYVPGCDKVYKNEKRNMFFVPKDPVIFALWKEVIPQKPNRPLGRSDRVCSRHFQPEDIIRTWTHTINGISENIPKGRASLKPAAVPSIFDEASVEESTKTPPKETTSPQLARKRSVEKKESTPKKAKLELPSPSPPPQEDDSIVLTDPTTDFSSLYDEIFEVTLPTTNYGFHRDPDGDFVAFTEFCPQLMGTKRLLMIQKDGSFKGYYKSKMFLEGYVTKFTADYVSDLLLSIDEGPKEAETEAETEKSSYVAALSSCY